MSLTTLQDERNTQPMSVSAQFRSLDEVKRNPANLGPPDCAALHPGYQASGLTSTTTSHEFDLVIHHCGSTPCPPRTHQTKFASPLSSVKALALKKNTPHALAGSAALLVADHAKMDSFNVGR
jgi:hypothetical protein